MIVNPIIMRRAQSAGDVPLGDKMYTFGVLSDIHLRPDNFRHGIDDFNRAIPCMQNLGAEFVGITGDIGFYGNINELELYQSAKNNLATVPFYAVRGNHDKPFSDSDWQTYTGFPPNYEFVYNGDVFLFLSLDQVDNTTSTVDVGYSVGFEWLKERLDRYKEARIFIFIHFPPTGYSGLRDGQYYGWSSASTEDEAFVKAINQTKNAIVFTGHTHYKFQVEDKYNNINIYRFNASRTALVHVPSCAYPRNANSGEEESLSQGYLVEVYEQGVIIRGVDLVAGELMPEYEYVVTIDNNPMATENAIIVSTHDISLDAGNSTQLEVNMASPASVTVFVSSNNSNITVSPASLVFTEDNYNIPQTVTITAPANINNNATSMVTFEANGIVSKTTSVTLKSSIVTTDLVSGKNDIVDGAVYSGSYSNSYLSHPLEGDFEITFMNLTLIYPQNGNAVYLKRTPINGIIHMVGTNKLQGTNRGLSSTSTTPIKLIGDGSATLEIANTRTYAAIKGDFEIINLDVDVTTGVTPIEVVNSGITIVGNGSYSVKTAKVQLLACEHGSLSVNVGNSAPGSVITITSTPENGYILSSILVNGVASTDSLTMPAAGETMTIQGVFVIDDGQQGPEPGPEEPTSTVIELPWVDNMQAQTGATAEVENAACMTTMEYIPIESGYSYEVSTTTLGTLGLRVFFYTGTNYTNYLDRSIDIGKDIFPTQYSYTLTIPSGATHLRLRAKTNGDHQTWKDRIILTKIRNA